MNNYGRFWRSQSKQNGYNLWTTQSLQHDQFESLCLQHDQFENLSQVTERLETSNLDIR